MIVAAYGVHGSWEFRNVSSMRGTWNCHICIFQRSSSLSPLLEKGDKGAYKVTAKQG